MDNLDVVHHPCFARCEWSIAYRGEGASHIDHDRVVDRRTPQIKGGLAWT
jgi:hypothetical protein